MTRIQAGCIIVCKIMGFVSAAAGAISSVGSAAKSIGGLFGGGGGETGPVFNAEAAQSVNDEYFDTLLDGTYGNRDDLLFDFAPRDVFGSRPNYYEVDFQGLNEQDPGLRDLASDVTQGNIRNFRDNARLSDAVNNFLNEDAKERTEFFDPSFGATIRQTGQNALAASRGVLPSSDAEQLIAGRNEVAGINGTAGTSRGQIARDLGLTRLQLQTEVAPALTQSQTGVINSLLPPQLRSNPRDNQVRTEQALGIAANDNQFGAQFDRNEQNLRSVLEASPDPQAQGLFNLQNALRAQDYAEDFAIAGGLSPAETFGSNSRLGGAAPVQLNSAASLFGGLSAYNGV